MGAYDYALYNARSNLLTNLGNLYQSKSIRLGVEDMKSFDRGGSGELLKLAEQYIAGEHCEIYVPQTRIVMLKDLGSKHGTFFYNPIDSEVRGWGRISPNGEVVLEEGDRIELARDAFRYLRISDPQRFEGPGYFEFEFLTLDQAQERMAMERERRERAKTGEKPSGLARLSSVILGPFGKRKNGR